MYRGRIPYRNMCIYILLYTCYVQSALQGELIQEQNEIKNGGLAPKKSNFNEDYVKYNTVIPDTKHL